MTLPVHLVPSLADVAPGGVVEVTGEEAHHAVAVRRVRVGEELVLTDGRGTTARGAVLETGKRRLSLRVDAVDLAAAPAPSLVVVQALAKGDRGERAVELLTEIGASVVVPWAAERSVAVWRGERAEKSHAKWVATAREAAKQARRSHLPEITPLASTQDVLARVREADLAVVLHEEASGQLGTLAIPERGTIVVVVGPEGGLAPEEVAALAAAGGVPVRLGPEVLRTSTAGLAAAAALLSRTPRWS